MLLGYRGGGGIAYVDVLCSGRQIRKGYCGIGKSFAKIPVFSFSTMVVAHELGHILGSPHTMACAWLPDGRTAIDKCPGYTEGGCGAVVNAPLEGGSIMSYCHMNSVGINYNVGFGPQPKALILNRIATATCLTDVPVVNPPVPPVNPPVTNKLFQFTITPDGFASEISWKFVNTKTAQVIDQESGYTNKVTKSISKTYSLASGDYALQITDSFGDGIVGSYGSGKIEGKLDGAVTYVNPNFSGNFVEYRFTIGSTGNPPPVDPPVTPPGNCVSLNFNTIPESTTFSGGQDMGSYTASSDGTAITIQGNSWKGFYFGYPIQLSSTSTLEFEFSTQVQAEIYGVGFDDDDLISSSKTFQIAGSQVWGYQNYNNYSLGSGWKKYTIPVGKFYIGNHNYIFFTTDNDVDSPKNIASFRNVRFCIN